MILLYGAGGEPGGGEDLLEIVKEAGMLYDIGKIGVREDILNKPENSLIPSWPEYLSTFWKKAV